MTADPLPKHVFANIISLAQHGWEYTHLMDGPIRHIDARHNGHQLIINTGSDGQTHATINGRRIHHHKIVRTIRRHTK